MMPQAILCFLLPPLNRLESALYQVAKHYFSLSSVLHKSPVTDNFGLGWSLSQSRVSPTPQSAFAPSQLAPCTHWCLIAWFVEKCFLFLYTNNFDSDNVQSHSYVWLLCSLLCIVVSLSILEFHSNCLWCRVIHLLILLSASFFCFCLFLKSFSNVSTLYAVASTGFSLSFLQVRVFRLTSEWTVDFLGCQGSCYLLQHQIFSVFITTSIHG